jgi:putative ABC transport system permease protein
MRPGRRPFEQALAKRLHEIAPQWSFEIRTLDQMRESALKKPLDVLALGGIVGAFLLLMSGLGLLGVLWQNVTRRAHEIGLRRAMGASRADIGRQVLLEVALTTTLGLVPCLLLVVQLPPDSWFVDPVSWPSRGSGPADLPADHDLRAVPRLLAPRIQPAETLHQEEPMMLIGRRLVAASSASCSSRTASRRAPLRLPTRPVRASASRNSSWCSRT